jgi:UDP-glucose 4-epimerase
VRAPDMAKYLVTGGAGFVGSHLCRRLLDLGHSVVSLDNYFTGSKNNHISGVDYMEGHTKDISKHIPETPDVIYHLGEYSRTEISLSEPNVVWDLNIAGTFGVLEFWRQRRCKLVYAGSSTKFADDGLGRDQSPYAWTKAANTDLLKNYGVWYDLPFAITYFYNVYGPGETSNKYGTVIEIFKQQYLEGKPLTVVSPGTQKRIFTHVDDIIDGLILVGEKGFGDEFGLGANKSYTILEIANLFNTDIQMLSERKGNRTDSKLNTVKSNSLGWEAKHKVEHYIMEIITKSKTT